MKALTRTYVIEFGASIVVYMVFTVASVLALQALGTSTLWRVPLALAPMVPGFFCLLAVVRHVGRIDEFQRKLFAESIAFAFGGTALLTFSYGFLQNVGFPSVSWFAVWPLMAVLWGIGSLVACRRYR